MSNEVSSLIGSVCETGELYLAIRGEMLRAKPGFTVFALTEAETSAFPLSLHQRGQV